MVRWRLLLEEFFPNFKHIAGIKKKSANTLSRLEMVHKASNEINLGHPNRHLVYTKNKVNYELCKAMVSMNLCSSPTDGMSDVITDKDAVEFIS